MFQAPLIAPSILSADFLHMEAEIEKLSAADADWVHIDVMDGHFVPNLTMGVPIVQQLRSITDRVLDVHLMISNPLRQLSWYLDAGADMVTIHRETVDNAEALCAAETIHTSGAKAAIALKPATEVASLVDLVASFDMVLIMSVEPGFSGQRFRDEAVEKVAEVVTLAKEQGVSPLIQVDGGISPTTVASVAQMGADVFVCGNAFFKAANPKDACSQIREGALDAQQRGMSA